jgi:cytochrome c-type biogenesis protein CcsB
MLLSITTFIYAFASLFYIGGWVFKKPLLGRCGTWVALGGLALNTAGILLRWRESYQLGYGHAPLSNLFESLIFFAWIIILIYLVVERRYRDRTIGAFITPLAFLAIAYASLSPDISDRIRPLMPALKSNWLIAHVFTCFVGYAAFAISFGVGIMYLIKGDGGTTESGGDSVGLIAKLPSASVLEELIHQMVLFGFLFLSIGIITGSVWANSAWGRYWGWDPKETWSLITWFVYAGLLHARYVGWFRGRAIAWFSLVGFAAVMFTYFGVNLLPGLHSYGAKG